MAELNEDDEDDSTPPRRTKWEIGNECVALRDDGRWYRAKVTDIADNLYRVTWPAVCYFIFYLFNTLKQQRAKPKQYIQYSD